MDCFLQNQITAHGVGPTRMYFVLQKCPNTRGRDSDQPRNMDDAGAARRGRGGAGRGTVVEGCAFGRFATLDGPFHTGAAIKKVKETEAHLSKIRALADKRMWLTQIQCGEWSVSRGRVRERVCVSARLAYLVRERRHVTLQGELLLSLTALSAAECGLCFSESIPRCTRSPRLGRAGCHGDRGRGVPLRLHPHGGRGFSGGNEPLV
jgi:hypothetical protein